MNQINDIDLKLSAQRALWGHVPPALRSASIEFKENIIFWRCFFDNGAAQDDMELLKIAGTEILADFPDIENFREEFEIRPFPEELDNLKNLVYCRHENK